MVRYMESECSTPGCNIGAKWCLHGEILCGRHCDKKHTEREPLDKTHYEAYKDSVRAKREPDIAAATAANKSAGERGKLTVIGSRRVGGATVVVVGLRHQVGCEGEIFRPGFRCVFPNFKHGNTKEGYGCKTLSPKDIGPVVHGMSNLPVAKNIENYYQLSKCFPSDIDEAGNPTSQWLEQRVRIYNITTPYRHSPSKKASDGVPMVYSVFYNAAGEEKRYSYLQSR
jgi:hypothetical protein